MFESQIKTDRALLNTPQHKDYVELNSIPLQLLPTQVRSLTQTNFNARPRLKVLPEVTGQAQSFSNRCVNRNLADIGHPYFPDVSDFGSHHGD